MPRDLLGNIRRHRLFADSSYGLSRKKVPQEPDGIGAQSPRNFNKLDHVYPPFATFILGNEGLRSAQLLGQGELTNAGALPCCD